jgi:hypothetical protein
MNNIKKVEQMLKICTQYGVTHGTSRGYALDLTIKSEKAANLCKTLQNWVKDIGIAWSINS